MKAATKERIEMLVWMVLIMGPCFWAAWMLN